MINCKAQEDGSRLETSTAVGTTYIVGTCSSICAEGAILSDLMILQIVQDQDT